jgi:hypothetical protein
MFIIQTSHFLWKSLLLQKRLHHHLYCQGHINAVSREALWYKKIVSILDPDITQFKKLLHQLTACEFFSHLVNSDPKVGMIIFTLEQVNAI